MPDPVLRSKTLPVPDSRYGTTGLRRLVDSMHETMDAVQGVGLAAPQVGISQALFVFHLDERQGHVINPVLETWGETLDETNEGCLSVPDLYYTPARARFARVTGVDAGGKAVEYEGEGLFARMLQHEVDHLNGYLFVDRLEGEQLRQARRAMTSPEFLDATRRVTAERAANINSTFGAGQTQQSTSKGRS